ncbi:N,N-dimethylformamidase beta subunit family domain-containing protein [uncultured Maribacter sp.]|uniref:N,N-dimethylformamidase beta subunit family domain-containing protein n=1 Tax=uncultured Maribacter sp. TaxID=431308 RepID=UPI00261F3D1B|nr:N,N-dimethylformamidase beta subunit family domain-containing protein [uncultured Maribacter sp.]
MESKINPVLQENLLTGSKEWKLTNPATKREIEGYASKTSVNTGEYISIYVNTKSEKFNITLFRMGWYNGLGGRCVMPAVTLNGQKQETPLPDEHGIVECNWKNPHNITIANSWTTGIYILKLEELKNNKQSYVIFVVRNDNYTPDILFQLPITTYQAYNYWGGKSLYDWGSGSIKKWGTIYGDRASKVSFNRPYACSNTPEAKLGVGAGEFFSNIQPITTQMYPISPASWDYNMVRWLEKNNYDVSYITNIDTHIGDNIKDKSSIFMSHGHDEYWSKEMRDNVTKLRDTGSNITFFSSNTMFWQVRLETSTLSNEPYKTLVCYKDVDIDPIKNEYCTVNFRDYPVENPEASFIGVQHFMDPVDGDIIVNNSSHWIFNNTNLKNGDTIPGLLGYEIDGITDDSPENICVLTKTKGENLLKNNYQFILKNTKKTLERKLENILTKIKIPQKLIPITSISIYILLITIFIYFLKIYLNYSLVLLVSSVISVIVLFGLWLYNSLKKMNKTIPTKGASNMTIYKAKSGAKVFSTGSMQWSWGLDDYGVPQLRNSRKNNFAEKITHNILQKFGAKKWEIQ